MIKYLLFKYLRFDKSMPFIMITKLLAFIGVALGVCVLIVSMAVMNGMNKNFLDKLLVMNYPISIYSKNKIINEKLIQELQKTYLISPFIQSQAVIKSANSLQAAVIFGVDFKQEAKINEIFNKAYKNTNIQESFPIILGSGFLIDDFKINLIFTNLSPNALAFSPTIKRFNYQSSFSSGLKAYDESYAYVDINDLKKVLKNQNYTGIHLYSKNAQDDIKILKEKYKDDYFIIGWWEQNGNFLNALELEKKALFFILLMIIIIASLNIISSLFMIVLNRKNEIALLLALGASKKEVRNSFFMLGFFIGFCGIIFGILLGFCSMFILNSFDIITLPADVYGTSKLPIDLSIFDFLSIVFGSILIVFLSALYPAYKASKIDILTTLRNE
ncbi:ABC transporter permease [Campylobacter canadensis]|uniref:ABC transporter permease n=1 Tax=Campylobacter canadensis TaxID=449520 RepID=A0ABS7WS42_9BACT|nr:ABC transporter permease [Campylobacter canadensis]MBZ7987572.1 ABC transporter permease [Campylobacter canadensis]MBZ7994917.1 ABC transporter permease [Campylobacter canadensis]MBZ7996696.1 ABC transporter permease [Campylobacter canadensis]MBZ7998672.1 ABC transporter permease [Campylobacter canadensis]MBZ8000334.1 ABC transporter permease [Campylobacter canadensis]